MVDTTSVGYVPLEKDGGTATNLTHSTGSIGTAVTAVTQSASDNSTKVATTAYADAAASGAGHATTALDNLAAVAINESLISDTDATDDLGSAAIQWNNIYGVTGVFSSAIELGHATDTTLTRASAGDVNVEGNIIYRAGGTDVPVADGGSGRSSHTAYAVLCGGTTTTGAQQSIASVGTSGHVLTSNGAGSLPTFQAAGGGGALTLLGTATASASASVDFDNLLDSTYDVYVITGTLLIPTTDGDSLFNRDGTGATPTYQSGASDYSWGTGYAGSAGTTQIFDSSDSEIEIAGSNGVGSAAGEAINFNMWIYGPSNTSNHTFRHATYTMVRSDSNLLVGDSGGKYLSTTAVTSTQFLFSTSTIASGKFAIYGYNLT